MLRKTRLLSMFLVMCMIAIAVAACAGKKNTDNQSSPSASVSSSPSASPSASETPEAKKLTITYYGLSGWDPIQPSEGPAIDMINEKFNIDYKVQFVPAGDYAQKQAIRMGGGDVPDMMDVSGDNNYRQWAAQGAFLPLDDYIDKYESLKAVPKYVWDQLTVNGHIYAIPRYFPAKFGKQPIIRQDWLDNLGLKMPASYEELKQVAIAFTKKDPDKNGKNDTYGIGLGKGIVYPNTFGAYWGSEWYQKNDAGQYIPGDISKGSKDRVQFLHEVYDAGAIPKDWPTTDEGDVQKAFYAGKFGIWFEQLGKPQHYFDSLLEAQPGAKLAPIPPFAAPDGSQGFRGLKGFNGAFALSAKLKDDPDKADRILQMLDYARQFIPFEDRTPQNEKFDWLNGKEGTGYTMMDGVANVPAENFSKGIVPSAYLDDPWVPADAKEEPVKSPNALQKSLFEQMQQMSHPYKYWIEPGFKVSSPKRDKDFWPLYDQIVAAQTKMIVGDIPLSDWDKTMKDVFYDKGGQAIIDEVNQMLKDAGLDGEWIQ